MDIHEAPVCVDCRFLDRERTKWPRTCRHVRVNTERDLVTGDLMTLSNQIVLVNEAPSCHWARYCGPCGHTGALFEPQPEREVM
ncbi:MAG: hypothetical protein IOC52_05420 [Methylobacterium sp.]|nr:hypothetical protein [Methylobacterium sp.]